MPNPQPPDIGTDAPLGPVPVENQPGHHPAEEQDKPDLTAFAERLGAVEVSEREEAGTPGEPGRRRIPARVAALVAAVVAAALVVVGVVAGFRRRSGSTG